MKSSHPLPQLAMVDDMLLCIIVFLRAAMHEGRIEQDLDPEKVSSILVDNQACHQNSRWEMHRRAWIGNSDSDAG